MNEVILKELVKIIVELATCKKSNFSFDSYPSCLLKFYV